MRNVVRNRVEQWHQPKPRRHPSGRRKGSLWRHAASFLIQNHWNSVLEKMQKQVVILLGINFPFWPRYWALCSLRLVQVKTQQSSIHTLTHVQRCHVFLKGPQGEQITHLLHDRFEFCWTLITNVILESPNNSQLSTEKNMSREDVGRVNFLWPKYLQIF